MAVNGHVLVNQQLSAYKVDRRETRNKIDCIATRRRRVKNRLPQRPDAAIAWIGNNKGSSPRGRRPQKQSDSHRREKGAGASAKFEIEVGKERNRLYGFAPVGNLEREEGKVLCWRRLTNLALPRFCQELELL